MLIISQIKFKIALRLKNIRPWNQYLDLTNCNLMSRGGPPYIPDRY